MQIRINHRERPYALSSLRACAVGWSALALLLAGSPSGAHGPEEHGKRDAHQEAMSEFKEKIPEELRKTKDLPKPPTPDSLAQGKALYLKHCAQCHGATGRGDGPAGKGQSTPPANFLDRKHSAMYGAGEKFWITTHGIPEMGMPGHEALFTDEERWSVVAYVFYLQGKVKTKPAMSPKSEK